jgi:hypothetical protein
VANVTICKKCETQLSSVSQRLAPATVAQALEKESETFFISSAEGDEGRPTYRRLSYQNGCRFC